MSEAKKIKEEIAKSLLYYRKQKRLTQKELADKLNVKHNAISSWESGTNSIDIEVLFKICKVLEVSVNDMFGAYRDKDTYTPEERELINKYRILDYHGKHIITIVMNEEYVRIKDKSAAIPLQSAPTIINGEAKQVNDINHAENTTFTVN